MRTRALHPCADGPLAACWLTASARGASGLACADGEEGAVPRRSGSLGWGGTSESRQREWMGGICGGMEGVS